MIPTDTQWAVMSWHARVRTLRRVQSWLRAHADQRAPDEIPAPRPRERTADLKQWAVGVRQDARARLAELPPDPDAAEHAAALLEVE